MKPLNNLRESILAKIIILFVIIISSVSLLYFLQDFYHDDAYIALRYAQNFLNGNGLVWNIGERVEGYTSLLWILLAVSLAKFGINIVFASRILGIVSLIGVYVILIVMKKNEGWYSSLLIASNGAVIAWSIGGLETSGFAFLITACLLYSERLMNGNHSLYFLVLGLLYGIAVLCRPETILFFAVAIIWFMALWVLKKNQSLKIIALFLLGFLLIVVPHLFWRLSYYGELMPNTFYVKAGFDVNNFPFGIKYILQFCLFQFSALMILALGIGLSTERLSTGNWFLISSLILYLIYIAYIGGDHMQWFRFFVPILPILYLLIIREVRQLTNLTSRKWIFPATITILFCTNLASTAYAGVVMGWRKVDPAAYHGKLVGQYIKENWQKNSLVALNTAGSTAFYSKLRCIDMLGLNDKHIARTKPKRTSLYWANLPGHRKGDGLYVLARKPDYIIIGGAEGYMGAWFISDKEIIENKDFKINYRPYKVWIPTRDEISRGIWFHYYKRETNVYGKHLES